jgi:GH35 family endo-1,4-beta-xylanase
MRRAEQRIAEIAARYGETIRRWEVVNEPCERHLYADKWCNLPEGYVLRSLNTAAKLFPATDRMMLNEANGSWLTFDEDRSPYYRLIREMLDRGARVDEFGMQLHIISEQSWQLTLAGKQYVPAHLFKVLDRYSDFQRPIHITELTIPALPRGAAPHPVEPALGVRQGPGNDAPCPLHVGRGGASFPGRASRRELSHAAAGVRDRTETAGGSPGALRLR